MNTNKSIYPWISLFTPFCTKAVQPAAPQTNIFWESILFMVFISKGQAPNDDLSSNKKLLSNLIPNNQLSYLCEIQYFATHYCNLPLETVFSGDS